MLVLFRPSAVSRAFFRPGAASCAFFRPRFSTVLVFVKSREQCVSSYEASTWSHVILTKVSPSQVTVNKCTWVRHTHIIIEYYLLTCIKIRIPFAWVILLRYIWQVNENTDILMLCMITDLISGSCMLDHVKEGLRGQS